MIQSFISLSLRHLFKHKIFTLINVLGLAVGMVSSILIYGYVIHELSYDKSELSSRIYRVHNNYIRNNELIYNSAATFPGIANAMKEYFPQVQKIGRYYPLAKSIACNLTRQDGEPVVFREEQLAYADPDLIELLNFHIIRGTAFHKPNQVLLSEVTAVKYFGNEDPIGKTLSYDHETGHHDLLDVVGIFNDRPTNSHLQNDILVSYKTLHNRKQYRGKKASESYEQDLGDYHFYTYFLIEKGYLIDSMEAGMRAMIDHYKPSLLETDSQGNRIRKNEFSFMPLEDIHLESNLTNELEAGGNKKQIYFLLIISVFILIMAWVNYINLSTSRNLERIKEVSVRKALGSSKRTLVFQFLVESLLVNLIALLIALASLELIGPGITQLLDINLTFLAWSNTGFWAALLTAIIMGSVLSGLYPAYVLASFHPFHSLKAITSGTSKDVNLRKGLIIFQFVISIILLTATMVVFRQLNYMIDQPLGFDKEQILVIEKPALTQQADSNYMELLRQRLITNSLATNATLSSAVPGKRIFRGMAISRIPNGTLDDVRSIKDIYVGEEFFETYNMGFLAGTGFESNRSGNVLVLNQSAVEELGYESAQQAVGEEVFPGGRVAYKITGVIEDYHHESLHMERDPMYFALDQHQPDYLSLKINTKDLQETLNNISVHFGAIFPGNPFNYFFLDGYFERQYVKDRQFGDSIKLFSALAIFLACLGLFGLTTYNTLQRSKEIGIRKVLGATNLSILNLFVKGYLASVLISGLLAIPVSYWILDKWLTGFAYKINLSSTLFLMPLILVMVMALFTVSFQTLKAAGSNPADTLKYE